VRRPSIVLLTVLAVACSGRAPAPPIEVRDPWARPADSAATTAAYFVVLNHEAMAVTLTAASSPIARSAGVHETMVMSGTMHMMAIDAPLVIAAGDSLVLSPGAKHLMVAGLARRLSPGDSLPLHLAFADGRVLPVAAVIRAP